VITLLRGLRLALQLFYPFRTRNLNVNRP